jgi:sugar phosphate isomerase/epimerase
VSYLRGFSTLGCPALELEAVCALARRHVVAVELRALGGTLDLAGHCAARFGTPAALAKAVRTSGVRVPVVGSSFALTDTDPAARAGLLALAPWAEASGARWLRVLDGKDCGSAAAEPQATLAWWREMRRAHGWQIDLAVETHDTLLTGAEICRFAVHSSAPILWDAHHTWRRGGEDPAQTWSAIREHVVHVHVKDSVRETGGEAARFRYVPPGVGEFPMAPLRAVLQREFAGCVSLEWERHWQPQIGPLEDALQSAAAAAWW